MIYDEIPEKPSFSTLAGQLGRSILVTVGVVAPIGLIASLFYAQALETTVASAVGNETRYIREIGAEYDAFYNRAMKARSVIGQVAANTQATSQLMEYSVPDADVKAINTKENTWPDPGTTSSVNMTVAQRDNDVRHNLSRISEDTNLAFRLLDFHSLPRFEDFGFNLSLFSPAHAASKTTRRDMANVSVFFRLGIFLFLLAVLTGVLFLFLLQYFRTDNAEKRRFADKMINTIVGFMIGMTTGIAGGSLL